MKLNALLYLLTAFVYFSFNFPLVMEVQAQNPLKGAKVCIDNNKGTVVVRKKCPSPKFTQVTSESLANATSLGGVSADSYLSNFIVVNESFPIVLFSTGDITGNSASCPEGYVVTGGGVSLTNNSGLVITRSIPSTTLAFWSGSVRASFGGATGTMNIYAICGLGQRFTEEEGEE